MFIDARVPVVFGEIGDAGPDDALLIDGDLDAPEGKIVVRLSAQPSAAHAISCVCCVPRSAAGSALAGLFLQRGRGQVSFFRRVVAVTQDRQAVLDAIESDVLASGWFKTAG